MYVKGKRINQTFELTHKNCILENVKFGDYVEIGEFNKISHSSFGDYTFTGENCIIQNTIVGKFSNIAEHVRLGPTQHPYLRASQHRFTYRGDVYGFGEEENHYFHERNKRRTYIGHDTWLGYGVVVMPEVSIGEGAVIGSNAVVTKDIPPYAIAVGVPAKVINYRFSEDEINKLQKIKWWNWSYEKLKKYHVDFKLPIIEFLNKHYL